MGENKCIDTEEDEFYDDEFWEAYRQLQEGELLSYSSVRELFDDIENGEEE